MTKDIWSAIKKRSHRGFAGYLKVEIFGPVFSGFPAETDPRDPPRSPGPAPHVKMHEKSAPENNSKAISRHPTNPARLPSSTQMGV